MTVDLRRLSASVAAEGLAGSTLGRPHEPLDHASWSALLATVGMERLASLLARAVTAGALPATEEQIGQALDAELASARICTMLERTLLGAVQLLDAQDIPYRVLKGAAIAHTVYPDPVLRSFVDVDLLVGPEHFERALTTLATAGAGEPTTKLRASRPARSTGGTMLKSPDGHEIDLYEALVFRPVAIDVADLFATSSSFLLGGRTVTGLGPEERFLHACCQAAVGSSEPRLVTLRDIAQILLTTEPQLARVRHLAGKWKAEAVVARAVSLAWQTFELADVTALSRWAATFRPDPAEERSISRSVDPGRRRGAQALANLGMIRRDGPGRRRTGPPVARRRGGV